jgi:uncharacterized integral membrane protein
LFKVGKKMTESSVSRRAHRQILGKRMGLTPYYTIVEQNDTQLVLRSRPGANAAAGRWFMGCGGALALLSVTVFCLSYATSMEDMGAFFSGMILSWPCGVIGGLGVIGGMAIAKTTNTIIVDTPTQTITYIQKARRERKQVVSFEQVAYLCLSYQPFTPTGLFQRPSETVVLEFITTENIAWLIDSAAEPAPLEPLAALVATMLGVQIQREYPTAAAVIES